MGQKVHPTGIRLGIAKDWNSTWYADKGDYAEMLNSDLEVRGYLQKRLAQAAVSRIQIERPAKSARITIHTARPGIVIGKKGEDIESLRRDVTTLMGVPTHITVAEIRKPELDAYLVAEGVAQQLERRIMFRRAMKRAVGNAMRLGALGIKISVAPTSRAANGIAKAACRCIRCAPTSITDSTKPRRPTACLASRSGFTRVKFSTCTVQTVKASAARRQPARRQRNAATQAYKIQKAAEGP
jgi:ribosomal protein S3